MKQLKSTKKDWQKWKKGGEECVRKKYKRKSLKCKCMKDKKNKKRLYLYFPQVQLCQISPGSVCKGLG